MPRDVTVKLNPAGVKDLLRSSEVQGDVQRRVDRIAAAAGEGMKSGVTVGPVRPWWCLDCHEPGQAR